MLKLEITGVHMKADSKLKAYAGRKIGRLDRFIPRQAREAAHAEVFFKDAKAKKDKKEYTCEVVMKLPKETITATESATTPFAAVDMVGSKLKNQLKKYKDTHGVKRLHRKVLAKLRRRGR